MTLQNQPLNILATKLGSCILLTPEIQYTATGSQVDMPEKNVVLLIFKKRHQCWRQTCAMYNFLTDSI